MVNAFHTHTVPHLIILQLVYYWCFDFLNNMYSLFSFIQETRNFLPILVHCDDCSK